MAGPHRVLVVDDEQYFRDTIRDALAAEGLDCEVASTASEAQKAVEDPSVACAIVDVGLGEGDATALLEPLLRQRPMLRVIALAGPADQERVLDALRHGACDYLAKPVHDEELCLAVHRALSAYAVEVRAEATRRGLRRLVVSAGEPGRPAGDDREDRLHRVSDALAELLGAERAAGLHARDDGDRLRVEGADALEEEERALLDVLVALVDRDLAPPLPAPLAPPAASAGDEEAELLRAIAEGMTREVEPERLLAASLRPVARATAARVVSLYLIDNVRGCLVREAQCEGADADRAELARDAGLTGGSLQSGVLVATDRPARDPRFDPDVDTPESGVPGPILVIPLRVRDRVLGVARIFPGPDRPAAPRLGELLGAPLSAATRNVLLYRSLLESVEDVARARREAEGGRRGR